MKAFKVTSLILALLSGIACGLVIYADANTKDRMLIFGFREDFVSWILFLLVPFFLGVASFALFIDKIKNGGKKLLWAFGTFVLVGSAVLMFCLSRNDDMYIRSRKVESPDGKHSVCYLTKNARFGTYYEYYRRVGTFAHEFMFASEELVEIEWGDEGLKADGGTFQYSPYDEK